VEQYQVLKTCIGREWFAEHHSPLIRATRGLVFLRALNLEELSHTARKLREAAEAQCGVRSSLATGAKGGTIDRFFAEGRGNLGR
jgi:hypothetical protein